MATERRRIFSIGPWAPALRNMVNSEVGPCGCLIGVYAAWGGETIAVVDLPHPRCPYDHRQSDVPDEAASATTTAERH